MTPVRIGLWLVALLGLTSLANAAVVAEWRMDEAQWTGSVGEVLDSSGNGNHGQARTLGSAGLLPQPVPGKVCRGAEFRGEGFNAPPNNQYYQARQLVEVPNSPSLSPLVSSDEMSLTGWFQLNTVGGTLLHKGIDDDSREYRVHIENNKLRFTLWNRSGGYEAFDVSPDNLQTGTWYYYAITLERTGNSQNIRMRGSLFNESGQLGSTTQQVSKVNYTNKDISGPLQLGAIAWNASNITGYFDGLLDEVQIHDTALETADIEALRNQTRPCAPSVRPVAEYRFDQCLWDGTSEEVLDSSGNDLHGSVISGAQTQGDAVLGRAGFFNASDEQYIRIPHDPLLEMSTGNQVSVSMWIKQASSQSGWITLLSKSDRSYTMQLRNGETPRFTIHDGGFRGVDANSPIQRDRWYHLLGTFDGDTVRLYVDGVLQGENTGVGQMSNAANIDLAVAENLGSTGRHFDGLIDEVKLFSEGIEQADAEQIYLNESAGLNWDGTERSTAEFSACTVGACSGSNVINGLPKMEVSSFEVKNTYSVPSATTVNFTQNFLSPPLVFTLPTTQGGNTAAHRIRNVTESGFEIITAEPESEDGAHIAMALNFLAIESGVYILPDGQRLEACSVETTRAQQALGTDEWETLAFFSDFTETPAVLGQIQTMANEEGDIPQNPSIPWLTTAISEVTADNTKLALERSETESGSIDLPERIAYLAAEPTAGRQSFMASSREIEYEIIRTGPTINGWGSCSAVNYSERWEDENGNRIPAIPLASMNSRLGEDDGGWLRRCPENLNNESRRVRLVVDEIRRGQYNYDNNRSRSEPERAGIVVFSDNFVTEAVLLDHLRFSHPESGIICSPSTLQLSACENSDCSTLYTGNVTATLNPSGANNLWSGPNVTSNQVEFSGGTVDLELRHTQPGQITLDASSTPVPPNPLVCVSGGNTTDCRMTVTDAGFLVDAPDLVANRPDGPVTLQAVRSDPNDPLSCAPAFSGERSVRFWSGYEAPDTGTEVLSLNGTAISTAQPGTARNLTFDANAQAIIPDIQYPDAGQIRLHARYEGSGEDAGLELTGSDLVTSRPAGFVLTPEAGCPLATADCANTLIAGDNFDLQIEAKAWQSDTDSDLSDNLPTPNYQQGNITLSHRLVEPDPGQDGTLTVTRYDHEVASDGASTVSQQLSEVGVFELDMTPPPYFGEDLGTHTSSLTARMIPADFQVTVAPGSLAPYCTDTPAFAYAGQALNWQLVPEVGIEAVNALDQRTQNYTLGGFNKLDATDLVRSAPLTDLTAVNEPGDPFPVDTSLSPGTLSVTGTPGLQRYQFAANDRFTYQKTPDSRVAPFSPSLEVGLDSLTDSDGVSAAALPQPLQPTMNFELRYGRLRLENAYGPETRDLSVPFGLEYFDGSGFVPNLADSCWAYTTGDAVLDDPTLTTIDNQSGTVDAGRPPSGRELVLNAPGLNNTGESRLTWPVPLWLQDDSNGDGNLNTPSSLVTFGVYRGHDRIIYWREVEAD